MKFKRIKLKNIIFSTNNNPLLLWICLKVRWFESRGESCVVVSSIETQRKLEVLLPGVSFVRHDRYREVLQSIDGPINLCFFHHNSERYYQQFEKFSKITLDLRGPEEFQVTFYPDGAGNLFHGERFTKKFEKTNSVRLSIRSVLNYGWLNPKNYKIFRDESFDVLPYSLIANLLNSQFLSDSFFEQNDLTGNDEVLVIPHRAWYHPSFHGGKYKFGSDMNLLGDLYSNIIVSNFNSEVPLFFRADNRTRSHADETFARLLKDFDARYVDEHYPEWLTMEPFIVHLAKKVKTINFIVLDSSTLEPIIQILSSLKTNCEFIGLVGCSIDTLDKADISQFSDVLSKKVLEYKARYLELKSKGLVKEIVDIDEASFKVIF